MQIIVKKPTETEKSDMRKKPVWECGVSEFDWITTARKPA